MKPLFLLSLITYFVPFTIEEGPQNFLLQNPFKDRVYLHGIPIYLSNYQPLYFENKNFTQHLPYLETDLCYFSDSLLRPSLSLFSIKKAEISQIGATFKSPVSRKDNQLVFFFTNRRGVDSSHSQILSSLKIPGNGNSEFSYAHITGKHCFSFAGNFKNMGIKLASGDFWAGELYTKLWGPLAIRFQLEGAIKNLTLTNENLVIGIDLEGKRVTPHAAIHVNYDKFNFAIEYGKNLFNDKIEECLHGLISIRDARFLAGIQGKIGKNGIFILDADSLIPSHYAISTFGVSQSDFITAYTFYSYPSSKPLKMGMFKRLKFKNGELEIEPGFNVQVNLARRETIGKFYLSIILFKAVEFRGGYEYPTTKTYFGAGVNLLD